MRLAAIMLLALPSLSLASDEPIIRTARSGAWSDPLTWTEKCVPGVGARILIREGHRVEYDVKSNVVIRGVTISGSLIFASDRDTTLNVGIIKLEAGDEYSEDGFDCDHSNRIDTAKPKPELIVGTPAKPIPNGKTALIRLHYIEGMNKETCPAIISCGGRMDLHGAPISHSWVKLGPPRKRLIRSCHCRFPPLAGKPAITSSSPAPRFMAMRNRHRPQRNE